MMLKYIKKIKGPAAKKTDYKTLRVNKALLPNDYIENTAQIFD